MSTHTVFWRQAVAGSNPVELVPLSFLIRCPSQIQEVWKILFLLFGISMPELYEEKCLLTFLFPCPAQTPPGKIFYSLAQSVCRMDHLLYQLPWLLCNRNTFPGWKHGGDGPGFFPPSVARPLHWHFYLLSVSGCVGFICEIDITIKWNLPLCVLVWQSLCQGPWKVREPGTA